MFFSNLRVSLFVLQMKLPAVSIYCNVTPTMPNSSNCIVNNPSIVATTPDNPKTVRPKLRPRPVSTAHPIRDEPSQASRTFSAKPNSFVQSERSRPRSSSPSIDRFFSRMAPQASFARNVNNTPTLGVKSIENEHLPAPSRPLLTIREPSSLSNASSLSPSTQDGSVLNKSFTLSEETGTKIIQLPASTSPETLVTNTLPLPNPNGDSDPALKEQRAVPRANKRIRGTRTSSSDTDQDFTSFVFQNKSAPLALSSLIQTPSTFSWAREFWNDPSSITYSPAPGEESTDWSINLNTLKSLDTMDYPGSPTADRDGTTHMFEGNTLHQHPPHRGNTLPLPTPMQLDPTSRSGQNIPPATDDGHPYRPSSPVAQVSQTAPLTANPDSPTLQFRSGGFDLNRALLDKLKITVNTCNIGISDRVTRSISLQTTPSRDIPMDATEHPVPNVIPAALAQIQPTQPIGLPAAPIPSLDRPLLTAQPSPVGILATANLTAQPGSSNSNAQRQAYFTRMLPQVLDIWRSFRAASEKSASSRIKAAFIRDMANKRRYPHWAVGFTPPPGVITTPIGAINLVNVRRQIATTGMHIIASILNDRAADHSTTAESHLQGLKKHYDQQPPSTDGPIYRFNSMIDLSKRLVERASSILNRKLFEESSRLKACPETALWVGIPISLVPANIKAFNF